MAVSGLYFVLFVLMHMYGNLKILAGHEQFDTYAHHLRVLGEPMLPYSGFLWIFRITLIIAVVAHVYSAFKLWGRANSARSNRYLVKDAMHTPVSSRTMRWGGIALLLFIVFHLLQFTLRSFYVGTAPVSSPAAMVIAAFQTPWLTLIYVLAMIALGLHLHHGVWSACQTLGFTNTAKARGTAKAASTIVAALVVIGFLIPPFAIQLGMIK
ncbi:succinate dehydrogenase cytochrome b subunit [Mobilicoccus pelagius NBRC 104925]|uniref:Succinate dehydrogenase cytochrome b subunit n=2 Tax=Mobilicoccus TaxID=984996 RepID=H5USI4_9MICO|nr:succinate dehydrogenase cytochrome b subunit [Mobilicoccus pelagius NBRC 104925]